jgi:hypothetical protein
MHKAILHPLSHRVTPIVRDLVQAHEIDTIITPSFRDRCDEVRRRNFQRGASIATPIFYRSQLLSPLSPESPTFLVDFFTPDDDMASDEWNVHITIYNMTHRFDVDSQWQHRFRKLFRVHDNAASESTLAKPCGQEAGSMLIKVSSIFGLGSHVVSRQTGWKLNPSNFSLFVDSCLSLLRTAISTIHRRKSLVPSLE